ncbi:WD40-repeat-containing domain protein [Hygrophoropsis aurantiaca]|uniref:WD40-repeat-containing domain protein n=1 Tax=Hygrophoropsis aurantiaca TaxID=72124 RepID=A0ACB8AJ40_9AGAM|nr:WD40-repeat-containing domain protein [Hygrophoropsis aurantiaca]
MSTSPSPELDEGSASHLPTKTFKGHTEQVRSVTYFKNGKRIVSGSRDKTLRIWNAESAQLEDESLEHEFAVNDVAISPNEKKLVSGGSRVTLWDLESRRVVWTTETANGLCVAISPDGQLIAASRVDEIELLDVETGERIREPLQFGNGEVLRCLAFSPDGARLAAGSRLGKVRLFNVLTGERVVGPIKAHKQEVTSVVFSRDGQQIITASYDQSIRVWESTTGKVVGKPMLGQKKAISEVALSPDGRFIAAVYDRTVRVWDLDTRRQLRNPLQTQNKSLFFSVAWSPDGGSIIAGEFKGNIYLWDVPPFEDVTVPVLVPSSPPLSSTSRSPAKSISSSLLDLPAGAPPPPRSKSNNRSRDDFFESFTDLSVIVHPPKLIGARTEPPANPQAPEDVRVEVQTPASGFEALARLWKQVLAVTRWKRIKPREDHGDAHEMQPAHPHCASAPPANVPDMQLSHKLPSTSTSRTVKVSAGYGFNRTHAATSDEDDEVPFWDYLCFCMCCPCKRADPDSDLESDTEL